MRNMTTVRTLGAIAFLAIGACAMPVPGLADEPVFDKKSPRDPNDIIYGGRGVTDHSVVAGIVSLIIPGIGQAINKNPGRKIATHLVVGLLGFTALVNPIGIVFSLFHVWSAWDALIDRPGGYINGCVDAGRGWTDVSAGPLSAPMA